MFTRGYLQRFVGSMSLLTADFRKVLGRSFGHLDEVRDLSGLQLYRLAI